MRMAKQHVEVFKCEAQITKDVYFLRPVDTSRFRPLKRIKGEDEKAMQEMCLQLVLLRKEFNVHDDTQSRLCNSYSTGARDLWQ